MKHPCLLAQVFPTENRALAMGTCSAMARIGSLITPFVSQVWRSLGTSLTSESGTCNALRLFLAPQSLFLFFLSGDAKGLSVFDPVNVLRLRSACWHRLPDAPHRDAGQGSAGVHRRPGGSGGDDQQGRPIKRCHNSLLGTGAASSKGSYISRSVCQRGGRGCWILGATVNEEKTEDKLITVTGW